jgi:hypothetical protein
MINPGPPPSLWIGLQGSPNEKKRPGREIGTLDNGLSTPV